MKQLNQLLLLSALMVFTYRAAATTFFVNVSNTVPLAPYTNWPTAATNIQNAIDVATNGDVVLVTNGLYATGGRVVYGSPTNRVVINKAITLQSVNGPEVTIILGNQIPTGTTNYNRNVRGVYMTNNAVLNGFSVIGSAARADGTNNTQMRGCGVYCESTNVFLNNCVISGNLCISTQIPPFPSFPFQPSGGGVWQGTLLNCVLSNNIIAPYGATGGGASGSVLNNCLLVGNSASFGGGAAGCILYNCSVIGNTQIDYGSFASGGGIYFSSGYFCLIAGNYAQNGGGGSYVSALTSCILSNNVAGNASGGGVYDGNTTNCLIVGNYATSGGGVFSSSASKSTVNCTIAGNTATNRGGGVYAGSSSTGVYINSIVYGNTSLSTVYSNYFYGGGFKNSWTTDPLFVDQVGGNFHLQSNSPCINAGNNPFITSLTDFAGNPRIVGGTVDIGAYEFQSPSSILSYAWAQQYGLPTDGSADFIDSDGDGMNNWQEWIAGIVPTNAASVLRLNPPANAVTGLNVSWQSVNTRTYYLQRSTNLLASPAFTAIQSNLTGGAIATTFTDTSATNGGPYFYRVGVQ